MLPPTDEEEVEGRPCTVTCCISYSPGPSITNGVRPPWVTFSTPLKSGWLTETSAMSAPKRACLSFDCFEMGLKASVVSPKETLKNCAPKKLIGMISVRSIWEPFPNCYRCGDSTCIDGNLKLDGRGLAVCEYRSTIVLYMERGYGISAHVQYPRR